MLFGAVADPENDEDVKQIVDRFNLAIPFIDLRLVVGMDRRQTRGYFSEDYN